MTNQEKKNFTDTLDKTRQLFKENKLDEAQKTITALIDTFTDDDPLKEDDECLYFDFKTAIEESIYRNEDKPQKKLRLAEVPVSNVYLISGSIAMEQEDYATALERMEEAMDWNPISPDIAFEYAEVVKRMGSVDQFLELTKRIVPHIYLARQLAHAYRNIAYYYEQKDETTKAIEAFFYSLVYEDNDAVKHELDEIGKNLTKEEKTINMSEFPNVCKNDGIPFGPDKTVVQLAYVTAQYFEKENDPMRSFYFYNIAYELTRDPKVKEKADEQRKKMDEAKTK